MTAKLTIKIPEKSEKVITIHSQDRAKDGSWKEPVLLETIRSGHKPVSHYVSKTKRFIIEETE